MISVKESPPVPDLENRPNFPFRWILILLGCLTMYMAFESFDDFVEKKPDGIYKLKQKRKDQLNDEVYRMRGEVVV